MRPSVLDDCTLVPHIYIKYVGLYSIHVVGPVLVGTGNCSLIVLYWYSTTTGTVLVAVVMVTIRHSNI